MRPGCQSYSGGEVAPRLKPAWIKNQGLYRRRGDGTTPGNRHQSAYAFIALRFRNDGTFEQVDLFGQGVDLIDNRREGEACRCGVPMEGCVDAGYLQSFKGLSQRNPCSGKVLPERG